jgi:hypothetical protein
LRRDLQEADFAHLEAAAQVYDELAAQRNWMKIECLDSATGVLRPPAAIHEEIRAAVEMSLSHALGAEG